MMSNTSYANILSPEDQTTLSEFVQDNKESFEPSTYYRFSSKREEVDEKTRKSVSVRYYNKDMLDFVISKVLNSEVLLKNNVQCMLARDHVTIIKYPEGGHFDWHTDHEKFVVNKRQTWIEGHLIYCIEPPEEGGELEFRHWSFDSKVFRYEKNGVLLFNKQCMHRAKPVISGSKIIMTIDVLYRQITKPSDEYSKMFNQILTDNPMGFMTYNVLELFKFSKMKPDYIPFGIFTYQNDEKETHITRIYDNTKTLLLKYKERGDDYLDDCELENVWHRKLLNFTNDLDEVMSDVRISNDCSDLFPIDFDSAQELPDDPLNVTDRSNKILNLPMINISKRSNYNLRRDVVHDTCNEPPGDYWYCTIEHMCGLIHPDFFKL